MNTRAVAAEYRLAHWANIIHARNERGVSVRAYCEQADIHENTYYYWQRKLREAACLEITNNQAQAQPGTTTTPQGWAKLSVIEASANSASLMIDINGCRILVGAGADMELLAKVCQTLRSL